MGSGPSGGEAHNSTFASSFPFGAYSTSSGAPPPPPGPNGSTNGFLLPNGNNGGVGNNGGGGSGPGGGLSPGNNDVRLKHQWLDDEENAYKTKQLSTLDFGVLPKDAKENEAFGELVRSMLGGMDITQHDFLVKWVNQTQGVYYEAKFGSDMGGFPQGLRWSSSS